MEPHRSRLSVTSSTKCITQERASAAGEGRGLGKTQGRAFGAPLPFGARLYHKTPHQVVSFSHFKVFSQDADVPLICLYALIQYFSLWKDVWKHLCSDLRERLMQAGIIVPKRLRGTISLSGILRMPTEPQDGLVFDVFLLIGS